MDKENDPAHQAKLDDFMTRAPETLRASVKIAIEKGASSWVTALPSYDHGTVLHKGEFVDSLYIRYGWTPPDLPATCACGAAFDVAHSLTCNASEN